MAAACQRVRCQSNFGLHPSVLAQVKRENADDFCTIMKWSLVLGGVAWLTLGDTAQASQTLSDFNNTGFDLSYGTWIPLNPVQTLHATYVDICNAATSNGGAGLDVLQLDISGNTDVVMEARLDPGNLAATVNLVFWDADGTAAKYTFNTSSLNTVSFTSLQVPFSSFSSAVAGSTAGLDLAHITKWDIEGDQVGSEQFSMQFDRVYVVPEPGVFPAIALFATGGMLLVKRRK